MKRFAKLVAISIQSRMYYRASFLMSMISPLLILAGQLVLWLSLYGAPGEGRRIGSFARQDMLSYLLAAFLINNLLTWSNENMLSREIRSGTVIAKRLRPVSFLTQSLSEMAGNILIQAGINVGIVLLLCPVLGTAMPLPSLRSLPLFLASLITSTLLRMLMAHCTSLLCFFTTGYYGIAWTRDALMSFFSGAMIPVALFPAWLQRVTYMLPFPLMLQPPIAILLGQRMPVTVAAAFLLQGIWALILMCVHALLYGHIRKNSTLAGG